MSLDVLRSSDQRSARLSQMQVIPWLIGGILLVDLALPDLEEGLVNPTFVLAMTLFGAMGVGTALDRWAGEAAGQAVTELPMAWLGVAGLGWLAWSEPVETLATAAVASLILAALTGATMAWEMHKR